MSPLPYSNVIGGLCHFFDFAVEERASRTKEKTIMILSRGKAVERWITPCDW